MSLQRLGWQDILDRVDKITVEDAYNVYEGWVGVDYYFDGELIASEDDTGFIQFFPTRLGDKELSEELVRRYWEEYGHPSFNIEEFNKALIDAQADAIRERYSNVLVVIENSYENETSPGFSNTYYIRYADDENDKSRYGWNHAIEVSEVGEEFNEELVSWATEEELSVIRNWF